MIVLLQQIMLITDINGKRIDVADLVGVIRQAILFAGMQHEDETFKKLNAYLKLRFKEYYCSVC